MTAEQPAQASGEIGNAAGFVSSADNVFSHIAGRYDLLCDLFSLGMHRLWKRGMAKRMARHPGAVVLDVASGTGDIPLRLIARGGAPKSLFATDLCEQMLAIARRRLSSAPNTLFALLDAERMPDWAPDSVDVYSISFGMKICDRQAVMKEAFRVLKPGGTFYCLEAARIPLPWLHWLYLSYMGWCMPLIGRLATGGDASAYLYLLRGVREFPDQASFASELEAIGFKNISWRNMTFGIVALHEARKPD